MSTAGDGILTALSAATLLVNYIPAPASSSAPPSMSSLPLVTEYGFFEKKLISNVMSLLQVA